MHAGRVGVSSQSGSAFSPFLAIRTTVIPLLTGAPLIGKWLGKPDLSACRCSDHGRLSLQCRCPTQSEMKLKHYPNSRVAEEITENLRCVFLTLVVERVISLCHMLCPSQILKWLQILSSTHLVDSFTKDGNTFHNISTWYECSLRWSNHFLGY
jgi:hypothetical protein